MCDAAIAKSQQPLVVCLRKSQEYSLHFGTDLVEYSSTRVAQTALKSPAEEYAG